MNANELTANRIVRGPLFPEPVQVIISVPVGFSVKLIGKGLNTGKVYEPILTSEQLGTLQATPESEPFDGDPKNFRLGIEAMRLALAFEYDPYFSLSIARVDPLPHQLEAVYDYFLRASAHPIPACRRSGSGKDHHGGSSAQGIEDSRIG